MKELITDQKKSNKGKERFTSCDEMGRGDFCELKEFPVGERKVPDHRDLVSARLLTLGAGERFGLQTNCNLKKLDNIPPVV